MKQVKNADQIIQNHSWFAALPGFFPVPVLDLAAITAIQLDMVKQLCRFYEIEYNEQRGKSITTALFSTLLGRMPAYMVRSAIKTIPVFGWVLGGITLSWFARASTYATGMVFKSHFEQGGTLNDLNPSNFKKFYKEQYDKGKAYLKDKF